MSGKNGLVADLLLLRRLWPHMRPDAWCFVYGVAVSPLVVACGLAQPYLVKVAIDEHISAGLAEGLAGLALLYLGMGFLSYLLSATYTVAVSYGGQRMLVRLRNYLYQRVLSLPQSFFDSRPAGVLLTRLTSDVDALGESIGAGVVTIVLDLLMIAGCLGMMVYLDPVLTVLMLLCSPVLVFVLEFLRRKLKGLFLEIRDAIAQVNAFLAEQIDGVEILQLFSAEERAAESANVMISADSSGSTQKVQHGGPAVRHQSSSVQWRMGAGTTSPGVGHPTEKIKPESSRG